MIKTFFDTNIFNHVTPEHIKVIKDGIDNDVVKLFTIPQILGELAATLPGDLAEGKRLCAVYGELIPDKVILQPPHILAVEVVQILKLGKPSFYMDNDYKSEFLEELKDLKNGVLNPKTLKFIEYYKQKKKESFQLAKDSKKKYDHQWDDGRVSQYPNFEAWWQNALTSGNIRQIIKEFLIRHISKGFLPSELMSNISKDAKKIEKNLHKLPHITTALKLSPALSFWYHLQKEKAKHGDLEDITNLVAVATLDAYVSNDEGARDFSNLIFPNKTSICLDEFIDLVKRI